MSNEAAVGPILGFRGLADGRWLTSALVVIEGDAQPHFSANVGGTPLDSDRVVLLKIFNGCQVWRVEWGVQQTDAEQSVEYSINGGRTFRYVVPGREAPLRIAYGSCFGFADVKSMKKVSDKNGMWRVLQKNHSVKPYHLMLMGGDQVYADEMFVTVGPLRDWFEGSIPDRVQAPFTSEMERLTEQFYFSLYNRRWSDKLPAEVLSQVPTLMMWDDHDIFDGWGSYPKEQQECEVFRGIYEHAREHFRMFQLQAKDDADLGAGTLLAQCGFTYAHRIGDIGILALDMRSERTQDQVMSLESWNRAQVWMEAELTARKRPDGSVERAACKHLIVMSSIPVVYVNANMLESIFGVLPGQQDLEDDFKDQWLGRTHQGERLRLIHRLLKFSKESGCRVTIVSGDVHVAALGYIQSDRDSARFDEANVINQFISSAVVHTPPPGIVVYMMERVLGDKVEEVDRGITARMLKFPGSAQRIIGARNWLSLTLDEQDRIWGEWYVEGEDVPFTKVVHPIGPLTS